MKASTPEATAAIRALIRNTDLPVVETFHTAGAISRELESHYFGRVGLFHNQPGDMLLGAADLVLTIGYDPIEYDPKTGIFLRTEPLFIWMIIKQILIMIINLIMSLSGI